MIIIDGYNIIGRGRAGGLALEDPGKERRLIDLLSRWRARKGVREEVLVVFDGREASPAAQRRGGHPAGLRVIYTAGGSADDYICDRVGKDPNPRGLTVVSSDRAIQRHAWAHGARVLGAGIFLAGIDRVLTPGESEKPEPGSSDIEKWEKLFSEKREGD